MAVGAFFVHRKFRTMEFGFHVLKYGVITEADVTEISNTIWRHNNRMVKEYNFRYEANGRKFNYQYQSAYKRHIQVGSKMILLYLPNNAKSSFIPELYNLDIKQ